MKTSEYYLTYSLNSLTWGQVTYVYLAVNITIIGSDNGLSPDLHQAIIWTNAGIFFNSTLGNKLQWNINWNSYVFIEENEFENVVWKFAAILFQLQCVKIYFLTTFMLKIQGSFFQFFLEEKKCCFFLVDITW